MRFALMFSLLALSGCSLFGGDVTDDGTAAAQARARVAVISAFAVAGESAPSPAPEPDDKPQPGEECENCYGTGKSGDGHSICQECGGDGITSRKPTASITFCQHTSEDKSASEPVPGRIVTIADDDRETKKQAFLAMQTENRVAAKVYSQISEPIQMLVESEKNRAETWDRYEKRDAAWKKTESKNTQIIYGNQKKLRSEQQTLAERLAEIEKRLSAIESAQAKPKPTPTKPAERVAIPGRIIYSNKPHWQIQNEFSQSVGGGGCSSGSGCSGGSCRSSRGMFSRW